MNKVIYFEGKWTTGVSEEMIMGQINHLVDQAYRQKDSNLVKPKEYVVVNDGIDLCISIKNEQQLSIDFDNE